MGATIGRRAKTPVFFIGQLESKKVSAELAQSLAQQYQDILPTRSYTPSVINEHELAQPLHRCIRRIKSQQSLRDLVKKQSELAVKEERASINYSDSETLLGCESPSSLNPPREDLYQNGTSPPENVPRRCWEHIRAMVGCALPVLRPLPEE